MAPADDWWLNALWSVTPTIMLGLIFWFIFRAIFRADRRERETYARIEAEERERRAREVPKQSEPTRGDRNDNTENEEKK